MLLSIRRFGGGKIICLFLGALPRVPAAPAAESPVPPAPLSQRQPLRVGVFTDAYPCSYIDSEGHLAGFTADVLDAVAKAVNLRIERIPGPTDQVVGRFQRGEFDLLQYHGVTTQEELLQRISTGELEGGFLSQLTELSVARKLHLNNIKVLGRPFDGYDIQQAFAARPGDEELLARLNEGIAIVQRTGEYDRIYRKNFSQFGLYILSVDELKLAASIALEIGFIVALWGYFRQRKLRKA